MKKLLFITLLAASANALAVCVPQIVYDPNTGQTYTAEICEDTAFGKEVPNQNSSLFDNKKIITCEYMNVYGQWKKVCH